MDFRLTDEQRALVDAVAKVRRDVLEPNAMKWLDGTWPEENLRALAEIGVMGMAVPRSAARAVLPSATMTFGDTRSSCSWRYGMHAATSSGSGRRFPGGRHFTMLQM